MKGRLFFAVTNDLVTDQRMQRICTTLANNGLDVTLIGRLRKTSLPLLPMPFKQQRLFCFFESGWKFYAEYNLRLFFFLLTRKARLLCAIDLDTILPVYLVSVLRRCLRVYDAHELFCEMKEVQTRPKVYAVWKRIERFALPRFPDGYTVNHYISKIFSDEYEVNYQVIRNLPYYSPPAAVRPEHFILYQGAVNEGRSFETLIPAFALIDAPLHIYGDGNFLLQARTLVHQLSLEKKVLFKGIAAPAHLKKITPTACLGLTIFEGTGWSNVYSLANRFFDYIQAGIPQVCVDYPAYREVNEDIEVAVLVNDLSPASLAEVINRLRNDSGLQEKLRRGTEKAREVYCWQNEEPRLIAFYQNLLP